LLAAPHIPRSLLASTAALLIAVTTTGRARTITQELPWQPGMATPPVPVRPGPWMFFTADEAALVEAAVDRSALVQSDDPTTLARVVLQGTRGVDGQHADRAGDAGIWLAGR
jgi:hypothetical protein